MQKPIELVMEETKQALIDTLNGSQLPHFVLAQITKDIYTECQALSTNMTKKHIDEYKQSLEKVTEAEIVEESEE